MKHFWKKANRGLLLGALLLVTMISFIIVKNVQFRSETPEIEAIAQAGLEELLALNAAPDGMRVGDTFTEAQKNAKKAELEEYLQKYWDFSGDSNVYYLTADLVRKNYAANVEQPLLCAVKELTINASSHSMSVLPNGTNYAKVDFSTDATILLTGNRHALFCGDEFRGLDIGDTLSEETYVQYDIYVALEMHRVGGEWKIASASFSAWPQ